MGSQAGRVFEKTAFEMGGPCWLVLPPGGQARRTKAPPCTDNFQVAKFEDGSKMQKKLQALEPSLRENDSAFGMRVWSEGQGGTPVSDWEDRKVEEMLAACLAKYQANPQMQEELLKETGDLEIQGAPSTWRWQFWNGRIQMKIRDLLADGVDLRSIEVAFPGDKEGLKRADLE